MSRIRANCKNLSPERLSTLLASVETLAQHILTVTGGRYSRRGLRIVSPQEVIVHRGGAAFGGILRVENSNESLLRPPGENRVRSPPEATRSEDRVEQSSLFSQQYVVGSCSKRRKSLTLSFTSSTAPPRRGEAIGGATKWVKLLTCHGTNSSARQLDGCRQLTSVAAAAPQPASFRPPSPPLSSTIHTFFSCPGFPKRFFPPSPSPPLRFPTTVKQAVERDGSLASGHAGDRARRQASRQETSSASEPMRVPVVHLRDDQRTAANPAVGQRS